MWAAGSVVARRIRFPSRARRAARAHAATVFPTPPLPVRTTVLLPIHAGHHLPQGVRRGKPREGTGARESVVEGIFLSVEGDGGEPPQCGKPLHFPGLEGHLDAGSVDPPGKTADLLPLGRGLVRKRPPRPDRDHPVHHDPEISDPERPQLFPGPEQLVHGGPFRTADQRELRLPGVPERGDGVVVFRLGALQGGDRPDARLAVALRGFLDMAGPVDGELEQAKRVTRGRGVEDHVVELRVLEEIGEPVERCDLDRAGASELFLENLHGVRRKHGAQGRQRALPVLLRGGIRIDLEREQVRRDLRHPGPDGAFEDVGQVAGRVRGDDQGPFPRLRRAHGRGRRKGGFAHPSLAGKERVFVHESRTPHRLVAPPTDFSPAATAAAGGHHPPGAGVPPPPPTEKPKSCCSTFAPPHTGQRGFHASFSRMDIGISNGRPQARHRYA